MPYPVMSGMLADRQGVLVDPNFSAWRTEPPWTGATLVSASNVTGLGSIVDARVLGGGYGFGFLYYTVSGNTISASLVASVDSANWLTISSIANTAGTTATAQWSGYYPYVTVSASYVSAGARTGQLSMQLFLT